MNEKIVDYKILTGEVDLEGAGNLTLKVQGAIGEGWQPYGSPFVRQWGRNPDGDTGVHYDTGRMMSQAMVRYIDEDKEESEGHIDIEDVAATIEIGKQMF